MLLRIIILTVGSLFLNKTIVLSQNTTLAAKTDTCCDQILNKYKGEESRTIIKTWLEANGKCCYLSCWMAGNNFDVNSREYLFIAIKMINSDKEYKIERFVELYELMKENPDELMEDAMDSLGIGPKKE